MCTEMLGTSVWACHTEDLNDMLTVLRSLYYPDFTLFILKGFSVTQIGLRQAAVPLPQHPECWDHRCVPLCSERFHEDCFLPLSIQSGNEWNFANMLKYLGFRNSRREHCGLLRRAVLDSVDCTAILTLLLWRHKIISLDIISSSENGNDKVYS